MIVGAAILLTVGFTMTCAYVDAEHLEDNEYIDDHTSRWVLRFIFFLAIGFSGLKNSVASALLFTALFDQLLNYMLHKKSIWYLGDTALWDIFFKERKWLYIAMKITTLLLSLFLFLK
jgi:hypothetical protein